MDAMTLLWVDARLRKAQPPLYRDLAESCKLYVLDHATEISLSIRSVGPDVIVFDFDYPDLAGLQALRWTRRANSPVPVLMLTEQHYENLAVWALRCRVWDYLIKPVTRDVLVERFKLLRMARDQNSGTRTRCNVMPLPPIPVEARLPSYVIDTRRTDTAGAYVENHLHEKVSEEVVARLCGMDRYEFSRVFKREHGITFREYLLNRRLERASEILSQTDVAITDVAFTVGFQDLSHFAHVFRRYMGCTPSQYRNWIVSGKGGFLGRVS